MATLIIDCHFCTGAHHVWTVRSIACRVHSSIRFLYRLIDENTMGLIIVAYKLWLKKPNNGSLSKGQNSVTVQSVRLDVLDVST